MGRLNYIWAAIAEVLTVFITVRLRHHCYLFLWVGREPHSPYCLVLDADLGQNFIHKTGISFIIRPFSGGILD